MATTYTLLFHCMFLLTLYIHMLDLIRRHVKTQRLHTLSSRFKPFVFDNHSFPPCLVFYGCGKSRIKLAVKEFDIAILFVQ